jgi:hypothetical protein
MVPMLASPDIMLLVVLQETRRTNIEMIIPGQIVWRVHVGFSGHNVTSCAAGNVTH